MDAAPTAPRRPRGRPPRISRDQIVAAARRTEGELTMQRVADALGVSRKALHYYVGDRQGLLTLVVLDRFESELRRVELPTDGDWRKVLRAYAYAFRDGMVQVGSPTSTAVDLTPFRGVGAAAVLDLAERVLDAMLTAGFTVDDARRGVTAIANIAQSAAQNAVHMSVRDFHRGETRAALDRMTDADYPALRRVLASEPSAQNEQFEFELDLAVAGLERLLPGSDQGPGASVALPSR
ncbi:TetR/AcrR family transcriptional regulator [Mycolicibacterium sp. F2034L]|uniref:TetR/AcrR family transcriptional regulator n=1 Tax=Mycolicibacterium sp. F2034L TaxID=2926422 RepID=UPI001FF2DEDA|nr:TetR/AcrR family transcriptional regulator C-terminal domain-containing protein [Mycolicibacterium sp. F2034L]MCK0176339.1 TetR/AcrR family transcriptional regulator C-terminal domain-containing protein [Mycolicibacterium sp. F2034L]